MNYTPRHAKRNRPMERIHTIIRVTIWTCIVIVSILLIDWIGREVILNLPW